MCPYGRQVMAMPKAYRELGTKIFIFAGEDAWARCRDYLDAGEIHEARSRYVLVCPPHLPSREGETKKPFKPWNCSWPVHGLDVLVIDCRLSDPMRDQLVMALKRDGAASAQMVPPAINLQWFQPWPTVVGEFRADIWDEELQPPLEATRSYWWLVVLMAEFINGDTFNAFQLWLMARWRDAPVEHPGSQALLVSIRQDKLFERLRRYIAQQSAAA